MNEQDIEKMIGEVLVKVKLIDQGKLKAIISLDFENFSIKGFRVMESDYENTYSDKVWLTPPSYRGADGKYHPIFYMPNKDTWKKLERKIWREYYLQKEQKDKQTLPVITTKEETDNRQIPF